MPAPDPIQHIIEIKQQVGILRAHHESERETSKQLREQQEEIKKSVNDIVTRLAAMPDEEHQEHHQFVKTMIREYEQRQQLRAAVINKIATGGAWALVAGLATLVWYGIKHKTGVGE